MPRRFLTIAGLAALAVMLLSSSALALNLRLNIMYNQKHPLSKEVFQPWAEQVAKVTQGRVKVTIFYSNALCTSAQTFDAVTSGVTDIGCSCPTYTAERFPLSTIMDQPLMASENSKDSSEVMQALYEQSPGMKKEFAEVVPLWFYLNPAYHLHFTKKEVKTLEDLKGLLVAAGGTVSNAMLKALGAAAEAIPMTEVYLALQSGVVEGSILPYAPLRSQRMTEVLKYHTECSLAANGFYVIANKDKWNSISEEDRKAIMAISGMKMATLTGQIFDKYEDIDKEFMAKKGDVFYKLPKEERARWAQLLKPLREAWVKEGEAKGLPTRELMEIASRLLAEREK